MSSLEYVLDQELNKTECDEIDSAMANLLDACFTFLVAKKNKEEADRKLKEAEKNLKFAHKWVDEAEGDVYWSLDNGRKETE